MSCVFVHGGSLAAAVLESQTSESTTMLKTSKWGEPTQAARKISLQQGVGVSQPAVQDEAKELINQMPKLVLTRQLLNQIVYKKKNDWHALQFSVSSGHCS